MTRYFRFYPTVYTGKKMPNYHVYFSKGFVSLAFENDAPQLEIQLGDDQWDQIDYMLALSSTYADMQWTEITESEAKAEVVKHFPNLLNLIPNWWQGSATIVETAGRCCLQCKAPLKPDASPLAKFCDNKNKCKMAWNRGPGREATPEPVQTKIKPFNYELLSEAKCKWLQVRFSFDGTLCHVTIVADGVSRDTVNVKPENLKAVLIDTIKTTIRHREFNTEHMRSLHLETAMNIVKFYFDGPCPFKRQVPVQSATSVEVATVAWECAMMRLDWLHISYGQYLDVAGKLACYVKIEADPLDGQTKMQKGDYHHFHTYTVVGAQQIESTILGYVTKVIKQRYFSSNDMRQSELQYVLGNIRNHFEENQDERLSALLRLPSQSEKPNKPVADQAPAKVEPPKPKPKEILSAREKRLKEELEVVKPAPTKSKKKSAKTTEVKILEKLDHEELDILELTERLGRPFDDYIKVRSWLGVLASKGLVQKRLMEDGSYKVATTAYYQANGIQITETQSNVTEPVTQNQIHN